MILDIDKLEVDWVQRFFIIEPMAMHYADAFYLRNYFSILPLRYLCRHVLIAIIHASNKFISSF